MSSTGRYLIHKLKKIDNCQSGCKCYQSLQQQINQLQAEVKSIPRVNEQKIIKQSIAGAEQLILPSVGVAIARALLPIDNKIAQLSKNLLGFGNTAKQALSKANTASNLATKASNLGNRALGVAKGAAGNASNALAKYGALATLVASVGLSVATLNILGGRIDAIESGQVLLSNDISKILGQILGIKTTAKNAEATAKIATKNATDAKAQSDHALEISVEAYNAAVKATSLVGTITPAIPKTNAEIQATSATATQALALAKEALALANQNKSNNFMDAETRSKLNQIQEAIGNLNVTLPVALIASAGFTSMVTNAAATGVCRSTKSGGCLGNSLGNISKKIDKSLINTAGIGAVSAQVASVKLQTGIISGQVATNATLIKGVGVQVAGVAAQLKASTTAILGKFSAVNALIVAKFAATWAWLTTDRTLNIFNAISNLHNAYFLSNQLGETLFSVIDNVSNLLFKDAAGQGFSASKALGDTFDNWAKGILGVSTWSGIKTQWTTFNRIYQSAINLFGEVQSMFDSGRQLSELIANNTGVIGNALKKAGAVFENAFGWMSERNNSASVKQQKWDNIINGISSIDDKLSNINSIVGEVQTFQDNINNLKESRKKIQEELNKNISTISSAASETKNQSLSQTDITSTDIQKSE